MKLRKKRFLKQNDWIFTLFQLINKPNGLKPAIVKLIMTKSYFIFYENKIGGEKNEAV